MNNNKNNNKNKSKVYKSKTRNKEMQLINLYSLSQDSDKEADKKLKILKICISGISVFMQQDHNKIVKELYFNGKHNIIDDKIAKMTDIVALSESTLIRYRNKYCKVADKVFNLLNNINL